MIRHAFKAGVCALLFLSSAFAQAPAGPPHNIILMIGDGMGVSQVSAARVVKGRLSLEAFKTIGLVLTHLRGKDDITDSAAGATALSTGVSTYKGAIAVGPDSASVETVLEASAAKGWKTGLVTVCSITDATPASFAAHVPNRAMRQEIAAQLAKSPVDLFLGSGWDWFVPQERGGKRTDGQDLLLSMRRRGFTAITSDSQFSELRAPGKVLGLFAAENDGPAQERRPSLAARTRKALTLLSSTQQGFFLMVEGSQIDWAGHQNNSQQLVVEMVDFDSAVGEAVDFAARHPETLVIVTADHETGGYAINGGSLETKSVVGAFTATHHTGAMVPLFALGPGAERFGGIHSNSEVGKMLLELVR